MNSTSPFIQLTGVLIASCLVSASSGADAKKHTLNAIVLRAFHASHDGWSTDEVLLQDELNRKFIARCKSERPLEPVGNLNWTLLNLRKAGKLKANVTKRRHDIHEPYQHLAEIAARTIQDKYQVTTDRIMCDQVMRQEFDQQARSLSKETTPYLMRKAAFTLRKTRRLRPELILRIADWDRNITVHRASALASDTSAIPETPGIYIFRDSMGYLYVGESKNLRSRLAKHLDESDRKSLANHLQDSDLDDISIELHAFPKKSRANKISVRRAYESALIASRKPRFNLRP